MHIYKCGCEERRLNSRVIAVETINCCEVKTCDEYTSTLVLRLRDMCGYFTGISIPIRNPSSCIDDVLFDWADDDMSNDECYNVFIHTMKNLMTTHRLNENVQIRLARILLT